MAHIITKGCKAKIRGKDLYLYRLDNEDCGTCKRLLKSGIYELEGKYQLSNRINIFVIEEW